MGLLDGILGNVVGSVLGGGRTQSAQNPLGSILASLLSGSRSQQAGLLAAAMSMLQQHGGIEGVLDLFRRNGMGQQVDSWVGTGANMGISSDQVQQVFGTSSLGNVASQVGMPAGEASSAIARLLPELVNQLTPQGQLPGNLDDVISKGLSMLGGSPSIPPR